MDERDAPQISRPPSAPSPPLCHACTVVVAVWCELAAVQWCWPGSAGALASFAGAAALVWAAERGAQPGGAGRSGAVFVAMPRFACFVALGMVTWPCLARLTLLLFTSLGGRVAMLHPIETDAFDHAALIVVAPLFEEALYRGRLLLALRARASVPLAVTISAAAFALPHFEPLRVLGAFLAGLVLGALFVLERRVSSCVAMHAGFNAAALWLHATRSAG